MVLVFNIEQNLNTEQEACSTNSKLKKIRHGHPFNYWAEKGRVTHLNTKQKKECLPIWIRKRKHVNPSKYGIEGMVTYYEQENIWSLL